jgi:hypothetical protein
MHGAVHPKTFEEVHVILSTPFSSNSIVLKSLLVVVTNHSKLSPGAVRLLHEKEYLLVDGLPVEL